VKQDKVVIYTAIAGGMDRLQTHRKINDSFDYVIFTDDKNIEADWARVIHVSPKPDSNRLAKAFKVLPHRYFPNYDVSVWIDGSIQIVGELEGIIKVALTGQDISFFRHYERNCIYEEVKACVKQRKDDPKTMHKQIQRYKKAGYPDNHGLIMGGVIIRRHNKAAVKKAMECWWTEINNGSKRDQLSFNYIAWRESLKFQYIQYPRMRRYFKRHAHLRR
jgi:hypothetical protein